MGPGLRLHALLPFLTPRLHTRLAERLGPGLRLHTLLPFLLPRLQRLADFLPLGDFLTERLTLRERLHPLLFFHVQFFLDLHLDLRAPEHGFLRLDVFLGERLTLRDLRTFLAFLHPSLFKPTAYEQLGLSLHMSIGNLAHCPGLLGN